MLDEKYCDLLIERLRELVRIPSRSSSAGGEEGRVQGVIAEHMRQAGARVRTFEVDDLPGAREHPLFHGPGRQYAGRPTVVGEIGPADAPALMIMAHSDTVPVFEPGEWTCDPFGGELRDGAVYGLGAGDDKWGGAAMLTLMRLLADRPEPLRKRLIFVSTIDEEHGVGNGLLILMLAGIRAEAALYLDGTHMALSVGNCGGSTVYLRPKDELPEETLVCHAEALKKMAAAMSREREPMFRRPPFDGNPQRDKSVMCYLRDVDDGPCLMAPFYTLPGEDGRALLAEIEGKIAEALGDELALYDIHCREPWFEARADDPEAPLVRRMAASFREVTGRDAVVATVSKQDAFVLANHARIPTLSFGVSRAIPRGGCHAPDECVRVEHAWTAFRTVAGAIDRWENDRW